MMWEHWCCKYRVLTSCVLIDHHIIRIFCSNYCFLFVECTMTTWCQLKSVFHGYYWSTAVRHVECNVEEYHKCTYILCINYFFNGNNWKHGSDAKWSDTFNVIGKLSCVNYAQQWTTNCIFVEMGTLYKWKLCSEVDYELYKYSKTSLIESAWD